MMKLEGSELKELKPPVDVPAVDLEKKEKAESIFKDIFSRPLGDLIDKFKGETFNVTIPQETESKETVGNSKEDLVSEDSPKVNMQGALTEFDKKVLENPEKSYYDDNDTLYRNGDDLKPNNTYEINGYTYETDAKGRIISAEGKLQPKDHDGRNAMKDSIEDIGKGYEKSTDDRGHLIGDQFNGSSALDNLVPQDSMLNRGEVKQLEDSLAKAVKGGSEVYLKVEPNYSGDSVRPTSFTYTYAVDGEKSVKIFKNGE